MGQEDDVPTSMVGCTIYMSQAFHASCTKDVHDKGMALATTVEEIYVRIDDNNATPVCMASRSSSFGHFFADS